jgi:hypothetical protein
MSRWSARWWSPDASGAPPEEGALVGPQRPPARPSLDISSLGSLGSLGTRSSGASIGPTRNTSHRTASHSRYRPVASPTVPAEVPVRSDHLYLIEIALIGQNHRRCTGGSGGLWWHRRSMGTAWNRSQAGPEPPTRGARWSPVLLLAAFGSRSGLFRRRSAPRSQGLRAEHRAPFRRFRLPLRPAPSDDDVGPSPVAVPSQTAGPARARSGTDVVSASRS